jgi:hypothetical protein
MHIIAFFLNKGASKLRKYVVAIKEKELRLTESRLFKLIVAAPRTAFHSPHQHNAKLKFRTHLVSEFRRKNLVIASPYVSIKKKWAFVIPLLRYPWVASFQPPLDGRWGLCAAP